MTFGVVGVIGVVGAGVMGCGLAQDLPQTAHGIVLAHRSEEVLERARSQIRTDMRWQRMLNPEASNQPIDDLLRRIVFTTHYADLRNADAVIENVTENWEVKREVHRRIDDACSSECLIAANTSAISITRIASVNGHPSRVIGMHFMNPVPLKATVEVICAITRATRRWPGRRPSWRA